MGDSDKNNPLLDASGLPRFDEIRAEHVEPGIRALLEGIVWYAGMAVAGGLLLVVAPRLELNAIAWLGAGTALVYLVANLRVRKPYFDTMVQELITGRPDLELEDLGRLGVTRLRDLWSTLLADPGARLLSSVLSAELSLRLILLSWS